MASSDDDEIPLASLGKKKALKRKAVASDEDEESDFEVKPKTAERRKAAPKSLKEASSGKYFLM